MTYLSTLCQSPSVNIKKTLVSSNLNSIDLTVTYDVSLVYHCLGLELPRMVRHWICYFVLEQSQGSRVRFPDQVVKTPLTKSRLGHDIPINLVSTPQCKFSKNTGQFRSVHGSSDLNSILFSLSVNHNIPQPQWERRVQDIIVKLI